jgi:hypothetical protein
VALVFGPVALIRGRFLTGNGSHSFGCHNYWHGGDTAASDFLYGMALLLASGRGGFPASAAFGIAGLQAAYDARCRTGATDNRRTTNAVEARR